MSGPVVLPIPSSPLEFIPQAMSVPFDSSARLWASPTEIATTPDSPPTGIGVMLHAPKLQLSGPVLFLLPSWPWLLLPQALTVPVERRARLWLEAAIAAAPESPLTGIGLVLHGAPPQVSGPVLLPSPSCACVLLRHARAVSPAARATVLNPRHAGAITARVSARGAHQRLPVSL